jgi:hypothetical protein
MLGMYKRLFLFLLALLGYVPYLFAQEEPIEVFPTYAPSKTNSSTIEKPFEGNLSSQYVQRQLDSLKENNKSIKFIEGYRILVYAGSDKTESLQAKEKLYQIIPEYNIYAVYKQPTYRIKVGDFKDRWEANQVLVEKIRKDFPNAILLPEKVNLIK